MERDRVILTPRWSPTMVRSCLSGDMYWAAGRIFHGASGIQIIFMKLTEGGVNTNDSYLSPWFGDMDGSDHVQLAGHGERVIGTFGRQGLNMDAIGLVVEPGVNGN
jgi:hypothetical protein